MQIDDAMAQLGQKMGVELSLGDTRTCRLVFDGTISVDFEAPEALADQLVMSCVVASDVFPEGREAVLQSMLEANFFGQGTGGGTLALDGERGEVLLQRILMMNHADLQDLVNALEQFLQFAEGWTERLKTEVSAAPKEFKAPKDLSNLMISKMRI